MRSDVSDARAKSGGHTESFQESASSAAEDVHGYEVPGGGELSHACVYVRVHVHACSSQVTGMKLSTVLSQHMAGARWSQRLIAFTLWPVLHSKGFALWHVLGSICFALWHVLRLIGFALSCAALNRFCSVAYAAFDC